MSICHEKEYYQRGRGNGGKTNRGVEEKIASPGRSRVPGLIFVSSAVFLYNNPCFPPL